LGKIDLLVKKGVDINTKGKYGLTPVFWAFQLVFPSVSEATFFAKSNEHIISDKEKKYDFIQAYFNDRLRCIELLLQYGANPNTCLNEQGEQARAQWFIYEGASLTFLSASHYPFFDGRSGIDFFPSVIKNGGDPNVIYTYYQSTPIFAASNPDQKSSHAKHHLLIGVKDGYTGTTLDNIIWPSPLNVGLLIEAGADIEHRDKWQNTPLIAAAGGENFDIVLMLLEAGADYTAMNDDGQNLAYFLYVAKHMNPKIDTEESIDPYYNKVIAFLKSKDYSLEKAYEELGDKIKDLPQPKKSSNARSSYQRPYDPYADEWIKKRKEKQE
jgi:hypothetical protein